MSKGYMVQTESIDGTLLFFIRGTIVIINQFSKQVVKKAPFSAKSVKYIYFELSKHPWMPG